MHKYSCEVSLTLDRAVHVLDYFGVDYTIHSERTISFKDEPDVTVKRVLDHGHFHKEDSPPSLRELIRDHQNATDCDDDTMVGILCDFIEWLDDKGGEFDYPNELQYFVVDKLDCGPMGQGG